MPRVYTPGLSQPSDERSELHEKFSDRASLVLSAERIKHALDAIESVDRLASVRELVAALS